MLDKFNRFMRNFMIGRYGADQLCRCTMFISMAVLIASIFLRSSVLDLIAFAILGYTYFRMFSRNISARYAENQKFLSATAGIRNKFQRQKYMLHQKKTHHIYNCPGCGQKIRIPRGSGKKVEIDCPKCHTKFIKKI
ncbi:MAG: hypothetical protein KBT01_01730 [Clostridiales bacterium]|nr:hypothetical protein [Candidatus Blautia equi]